MATRSVREFTVDGLLRRRLRRRRTCLSAPGGFAAGPLGPGSVREFTVDGLLSRRMMVAGPGGPRETD